MAIFCGRGSRALVEGLLHNLRFGLIGGGLLILQRVCRGIIRRRLWNFSANGGGVRRLGKTAGALFGGKRLQAIIHLLLEVIVHFLQVVHGNGDGFAGGAIGFLAAGDDGRHFLVGIGRGAGAREYIAAGESTFLTVGNYGEIAGNDERGVRGIKRGRYFARARRGCGGCGCSRHRRRRVDPRMPAQRQVALLLLQRLPASLRE